MALDRTWYNTLVDDDGSGMTGSVWDKADVDSLMDVIDAEFAAPSIGGSMASVSDTPIAALSQVPLNVWTETDWDYPAGQVCQSQLNLVCPAGAAGIYLVTCNLSWAPATAGGRYLYLYRYPGAILLQTNQIHANGNYPSSHQLAHYVRLAPGEYVNMQGFQNSGAPLAVLGGGRFQMVRVGRY